MPLRMRIFDREAALRRFKKLLERSSVPKELRRRKYYEKPCKGRSKSAMARTAKGRSRVYRSVGAVHRLAPPGTLQERQERIEAIGQRTSGAERL
jgi:small subunit ribosomal protein S21